MSYIQRNLLPLIVGLLSVVAIVIGTGSVVLRMGADDRITDEQSERELGRGLDGAMRGGSASLGVQLDTDLRVTSVIANGPAAAAGIRPGDQLLAVNGNEVKTVDEMRTRLAAVPPEGEYSVTVRRDGKNVDLRAKKPSAMGGLGGLFQRFTEQAPSFGRGRGGPGQPDRPPAPPPPPAVPPQSPVLGVSVQPVAGGLRVIGVTPGSAAANAGVLVEDVLVSANARTTTSVEGLQSILLSAGPGGAVTLSVRRGAQQLTLTAQLAPRV